MSESTNEQPLVKRTHKYDNEQDRHEASKAAKRNWYWKNKDKQKLKSLKAYYIKQLTKTNLKEETKTKYENKLNDINSKLTNV